MYGVERKIRRWLQAERQERSRRAEQRLGHLLRELPDLGPAPGFAARVLVACGMTAPLRSPAFRWLLRTGWAVEALALLAVGLGLLLLPALGRAVPAGAVTALAAAAGQKVLLGAGDLLAASVRLWTGFAELGDLVGRLLRTPVGAGMVTALLVCGYTLLWSLDRLLAAPERTFGRSAR